MQVNRAVFQRSPALPPPCEWIEIREIVFLSPSVWLCCVYHDARDQERIDTAGEASRLHKLLALRHAPGGTMAAQPHTLHASFAISPVPGVCPATSAETSPALFCSASVPRAAVAMTMSPESICSPESVRTLPAYLH